eukprot:629359_1
MILDNLLLLNRFKSKHGKHWQPQRIQYVQIPTNNHINIPVDIPTQNPSNMPTNTTSHNPTIVLSKTRIGVSLNPSKKPLNIPIVDPNGLPLNTLLFYLQWP